MASASFCVNELSLLLLQLSAVQYLSVPRPPLRYGVMWGWLKREDMLLECERVHELAVSLLGS